MEGFPSGQIRQSQAPCHPRHTVVDCGYDPSSACKTTTSHVGHCCSPDLSVLPPSGQTFVSASLSTICDCTRSRGIRDVDVLGFSAGSYTGLAIHEVLNEFDCFPGTTKVAAIVSPPEMLRFATGERRVILLHCLEDRLCVWHPGTLTDLIYDIVLIEGHPSWSGRARHAYGHLLFNTIGEGTYH